MPFVPLTADTGEAQPKQGFTPISTPLEYSTSPIVERAKYVAGAIPGAVETTIGGMADFGGTIASGIGGIAYGALPAMLEGQKINWSDPNNPFYQEYAKEQGLWSRNISPVLAPQTEVGKDIMGGFGTVAEKMRKMGEKVTDITGSEAAGAWTEAGLQTLGIPLGMKAAGIIPMAGGGVAALLAKGKRAAGAPSGAPTAEGPRAPIPGEASVADQLKAIRPVPPEAAPTPDAAPQGFTPELPKGPTPEESAQMAKDAAAYRKLQEDLKAGAPPTEEQPITPPPGAATFMPKPGDVPTAPRHASPGIPVQEVPLAGLKLSQDVPQFKKEANAQGVVVPLGGKFDRVGVAPIQIWQRLNGDQEIISGRHRFDLAKRSGEETMPAQIHREADGFTKDHAAVMDAELNIRDEQGGVNDYANYFRTTGLDEETAKSRGLLARAKGRAGYAIATQASDDVFAAHGAGIISDEAALAFSRAAPKDSAAQAVGLKMLNEGRSISQAENTIRAIAMMQKNGEAKPEQGDIFGFDDSAIRQAEEMARKASAAQRTIREQLAAVSGATKRPEVARKLGVDVKDPEAVKASIDRLRAALDRLANWPLYPDLVREFRGEEERPPMELKSETETEIKAKVAAKEKSDEEARKKESAPPPEDFVMTGSTRPADEAAARGQNDMFGNTPLKEEKPSERRNTPERTAMYGLAKDLAELQGKIGIGSLRRKYPQFDESKAARILEQLETDGVIGPVSFKTGNHELLKGEEIEKAAETKPSEKKPETPRQGEIGMMMSSGEVVKTATGRETTPFPKIGAGPRGTDIAVKAVDRWLIDNAIAEAQARGDDFNITQFENVKKPSQADKDSAEQYLFGDEQPPVQKPILKPLRKKVADVPSMAETGGTTKWLEAYKTGATAEHPAPLHDALKSHVETLIKRKRFADELHLGRKLDSAITKAKAAMESGEGKAADFTKIAKWFAGKDDQTHAALMSVADTLKQTGKVDIREPEAQYDLFHEDKTEPGVSKDRGSDRSGEPPSKERLIRAARSVQLKETEATPGIYYVTAKIEKVGERDLPAKITSSQDAANATTYLSRFAVEHFDAIVTDKAGKPLAVIGSFKGAATQTSVYPSTLMQELAKIKGAANVWASHNHPSGLAELSQADRNLSAVIENLLRGSGVKYRGLMAVAGGKYTSTTFDNGDISKTQTEMVKAPIAERVTEGDPLHDMTVNTPGVAKTITPNIAKDKPGILFLSAQNAPVAFVPLDVADIYPLRENGRLMKLFNSAGSTGASAAILANPDGAMANHVMSNLSNALTALDIKTLDIISYDSKSPSATVKSGADMGSMVPGFEPSGGEVRDSAQDGQVHRLLDQHKGEKGYTRDDAVSDYMDGKRADYELFGGDKNAVHQIINFNIGITPADLARAGGQIGKDAKAVLERAKSTKMGAAASEWTEGIWHDVQMGTSPMTTGSNRAMAIATDWASADRKSRWQMAQFDDVLRKLPLEQQENMAVRMNEENDILRAKRKGLPVPEGGLAKLSPEERAVVDKLHNDAELIAQRARDKGRLGPKPVNPEDEGVDYWSPRQIVVYSETGDITTPKAGKGVSSPFTSPTGRNITTSAPSLLKRKHETLAETEAAAKAKFGEGAKVAMNIRAMPLAMARIERAIAGAELIDGIKSIGEKTGQDLVINSEQPGYFTVDHPAFKTFRPKTTTVDGKTTVVVDQNGKTVFDKVPLYVSKEFEGPLKAIMSDSPSNIAKALTQLKGKSMGVIMYSPAIHNGVEFGRVLPAMPGKTITFRIYFDGAKARKDPAFMNRMIGQGNMVPINRSFAMQDITGIMEDPTLHAGRSWTSQVLAAPVGLFSKRGAEAVKRGVDTAGDIWHNTLLWDRIADLQAGIAYNVEMMEIKKGTDPLTATRIAGHEANRFAGALPYEAMSKGARDWANFLFFSRTFTMGNWGVAKDALKGLPRNVAAQIERDAGTVAMYAANNHVKKMAMKAIATDIVMMYAMNSALQSGFDKWKRDKSNDEISQGYADRFDAMIKRVQESPAELLHPFDQLASLTPMSENEPGKEYRVLYDYDEQGTAIYMRLPPGKMGEEYITYATSPLEMLKRKEGTIFRPLIQAATNDKGFGRKVYDDQTKGYKASAKAMGNIAWNILSQQIPMDSINAAVDIARGESEQADAYKVIGPFFGLTFSKGAPGGPEVGELFTVERQHRAEISDAMPDIKRYIKQGNMDDAVKRMYDSHFTPQEIRATIKFSMMPRARLTPQAMKKFYETSTPEQKQKMQDIQQSQP